MRALLLLGLLLIPLAALPAQPAKEPEPARASTQQALVEAERRSAVAEREIAVLAAADRIEDAITQQAYNRFEIWTGAVTGFFGVLVTVLVVVFGFRTERSAGIAAGLAARQEVAAAKGDIETLLKEAQGASTAARMAAEEASAILEKAREETDRLSSQARAATADIQAQAQQADEVIDEISRRGAEAIARAAERHRVTLGDTVESNIVFTEQEAQDVKAGAEATSEKSPESMTVNEFITQIGNAAYLQRDHEKALRLATELETYHPDDELAVSFALRAQGDALHTLGRFERALGAYADLIRRFGDSVQPEVREHVLWARHHRGVILIDTLRYAEAEREFEQLIPLQESFSGLEHPNVLAARQGLARALLDQGRAEEAEKLLRILLPLRQRLEGEDGRETLVIRHELGRAMLRAGRVLEAEAELRPLLAIKERVSGSEDRETLITRVVLARIMILKGQMTEAEQEYAVLIPLMAKVMGEEHPDTLLLRGAAVGAVLAQDKVTEAQRQLSELLPLVSRVFGPDHSEVLGVRHDLAVVLLESGEPKQAELALREILPLVGKAVGGDDRMQLGIRQSLARALIDQERAAEAEAELIAIIPAFESARDRPGTVAARHQLAIALLDQGHAKEAEKELRGLLPSLATIYPGHPIVEVARSRLAETLLAQGRVQDAARLLQDVPEQPQGTGWSIRWRAGLAFARARLADAQGDRSAADGWLQQARTLYASVYPPDHPMLRRIEAYSAARGA